MSWSCFIAVWGRLERSKLLCCHCVRNWLGSHSGWVTPTQRHEVDDEAFFALPIPSTVWKTPLGFLICWYHKNWKSGSVVLTCFFPYVVWQRESEWNAGLSSVVFTPTQSSTRTLATFVCLVFPLFSCCSHSCDASHPLIPAMTTRGWTCHSAGRSPLLPTTSCFHKV